jgi:hypothetical protein
MLETGFVLYFFIYICEQTYADKFFMPLMQAL